MKITIRDALITAISYADIFDYPLTEEELLTWVPFRTGLKRSPLSRYLELVEGHGVTWKNKRLFAIRKQREAWSVDKWIRAKRVANLLRWIPTINLIGVTGGLTRSNAKAQDDIDLFIITAPKTIWVTRAISTILLDMFRLRRRPQDRSVQNLMCMNMFMSEDGLALPKSERDFFTAHEVLLMTPLWDRDEIYIKFLSANRWARIFLPNAWKEKNMNIESRILNYDQRRFGFFYIFSFILHTSYFMLRLIEPFARMMQLRYMSKRRSTEVVTDHVIRFHPRDARIWIKRKLEERLMRFNIPLDKIFYAR